MLMRYSIDIDWAVRIRAIMHNGKIVSYALIPRRYSIAPNSVFEEPFLRARQNLGEPGP